MGCLNDLPKYRICFRKHPNGILYGCEHCSYKSTTKETLRKHVRKQHGADPLEEEEEEDEDSPYAEATYVYYDEEQGEVDGEVAVGTLVLQAGAAAHTNSEFLFCEEVGASGALKGQSHGIVVDYALRKQLPPSQ
jgi:hypothetical protein